MLPDGRIRFPALAVDFNNDVGLSGSNHDNYPPAGGQARYDHMRMVIIGLLSQQASYDEPTEYRDGTPWFDLNEGILKIRFNGTWTPFSQVISVAQDATGASTKTLAQFYSELSAALVNLSPEIVYSGSASVDGVTSIPIPTSLRGNVYDNSRPFVHINGLLVDPRNTTIAPGVTPTTIALSGVTMNAGDTFTVLIRRIPDSTFYTATVTAT